MKLAPFAAALFATTVNLGCGDTDNNNGHDDNNGNFSLNISDAEMKPSEDLTPLEEDDMLSRLQDVSYLSGWVPEEEEDTDEGEDPIGGGCDNPDLLRISGDDTRLEIRANLQKDSCPLDPEMKVKELSVQSQITITCEEGGLSKVNLETLKTNPENFPSLDVFTELCPSGKGSFIQSTRFDIDLRLPFGGEGASIPTKVDAVSTTRTAEKKACSWETRGGKRYLDNGCVETMKSYIDLLKETNNFQKAELKNVVIDLASKKIVAGEMDVILNDWQGKVTFGEEEASYRMTRGEEVSEGEI